MSLLFNAAKKDTLRRLYREKRRELDLDACREQDTELCRIISELSVFSAASTVLLYAPKGAETDVLPLAHIAKMLGKRVAFPLCDTDSKTMTFRYVNDVSELNLGAYGIREPSRDAEVYGGEPAVCIVPGLAFDKNGNRLGYGGGYYDRFLSAGGVTSIAPVREGFFSEAPLPADRYDVKIDIIVTVKGGALFSHE